MNHHFKKWCIYTMDARDSRYVSKIILFVDNKILFLVSNTPNFKGNLDLPGGHIHRGEDLIEGLKREVLEETGLDIKNPIRITQKEDITFYCSKLDKKDLKNIKLSFEHSDYETLTIQEVEKSPHPITPMFLEVVKEAKELKDKGKIKFINILPIIIIFSSLLMLVKGLYN